MSGSNERVQEALAAHLEHVEFGGPQPDTSHLTPEELEELNGLVGLLDQTEGVAFGRGLDVGRVDAAASTEAGQRLLTTLRDVLPSEARIGNDPAAATLSVSGMEVVEGFVVGTFGGRIRVWLLADESALERSDEWLRDLDRVFRVFADTVAIALVEPGHSCLLVQPEDCAPKIEVPRGSLVGRRYRRPIHPVTEVLTAFLRELIPYWEPMAQMSDATTDRTIDVPPIAHERAGRAIEDQVAAGGRARKTNPKRKALTELGDDDAAALAQLLVEVHEGRAAPDGLEDELRRLATKR